LAALDRAAVILVLSHRACSPCAAWPPRWRFNALEYAPEKVRLISELGVPKSPLPQAEIEKA
jgi:hypothetical protein